MLHGKLFSLSKAPILSLTRNFTHFPVGLLVVKETDSSVSSHST